MEIFKATVKEGQPTLLGYEADRWRKWAKENEGHELEVRQFRRMTYNQRKFFEGPVSQYFFYQHDPGAYQNFKEARDTLVLEAYPIKVRTLKGEWVVKGGSTANKTDKWMSALIDRIHHQIFEPNGYEFPDPQEYENWINSAPMGMEIFPPLKLLKENYERRLKEKQ